MVSALYLFTCLTNNVRLAADKTGGNKKDAMVKYKRQLTVNVEDFIRFVYARHLFY